MNIVYKKKYYFCQIVFLLCFYFCWLPGYADKADTFFIQHYDNRNGLSNSSINKLFKDSDDMLWVGTWDGLNMYDGFDFHVFNYGKNRDSKSIGSNVIQNISEDKTGNLWITTIEGVSKYSKSTGKFTNYFYNQNRSGKLSEQEYTVYIDTVGNVYCLNQKTGLSFYDLRTDTFLPASLHQSTPMIKKMFFDQNNDLWLLTTDGRLELYAGNNGSFRLIRTYSYDESIVNFFVLNSGIFFITGSNTLYSLISGTGSFEKLIQLPNPVSHMIFNKDHYYFAWTTKGLGIYNQHFNPSEFMQSAARQMHGIKVTALTMGTEGILWLGTDGNGLIKISPRINQFGTATTSEERNPYNKSVRAFCRVNDDLWVATKGSGIFQYKQFWKSNNQFRKATNLITTPTLDNNDVYALKKGADNLIYIGSDGWGLTIYDIHTREFIRWNAVAQTANFPPFRSVYAIHQDEDHSLWLGTSGYGLIHLKIEKTKQGKLSLQFLEKYTSGKGKPGPANDIIYSIVAGSRNQLWIGCRYGGLSLLDKKTKQFKTFKALAYEGSLSNNDVLSIFKDRQDRIWVGTSFGLNWISSGEAMKMEPKFQRLTTMNGLPNNTIHAIEEDEDGFIWVSTNKGLARLNPENLEISYYQYSDGLQSNEFSDGAVWKDTNDNLYFGGIYGFNSFRPQNITKSDWLPNLLISGISFGGSTFKENGFSVLKPNKHNEIFQYTLNRSKNFFELNLKTLSYLNGEKSEYAYLLKGYNKEWYSAGRSGRLNFSNVPPGTYTLKVKWSNGDGYWTQPSDVLILKINQYPWLNGYAKSGYFLLILLLVFLFYKYNKNKSDIRHQLEVEHLLRKKEKEIHQNRIGFFTNIAHELQTPLTLIMGASERQDGIASTQKTSPKTSYYRTLIHQQASKLTYLVQQLMEFRKAEEAFFKNQYSYGNISEFLHNLAEPFLLLSEQIHSAFEINIEPNITGWIDKDKTEKIIYNLLSNAFKYSGKHEQILFSSEISEERSHLVITLSNSGVKMDKKQVEKLFDQFYSASENQTQINRFGTGIGLAFARQLANMINGNLKAEWDGHWIHFKLTIPLTSTNEGHVSLNKNNLLNEHPSYLFSTITNYSQIIHPRSAIESNKEALVENLLDDEKKKILVVEDDPEIRYLIKDILKNEYIIYEAEDGQDALDMIGRIMPSLVICDIMMPNLNGLKLCATMKEAIPTCQIPFIILSALGTEDQHMAGYEVGADAYIDKPFNATHLKLRIRKLLEYREKLHLFFSNNKNNELYPVKDLEIEDADKNILTSLVNFIEENISSSELTTANLEKEFYLSKMQLYRKLKSLTGLTPAEFIKSIRLKTAARLLQTTNLNVLEIFYQTGFNNQSYFFREFKKRYHCSPNEYRENNPIIK